LLPVVAKLLVLLFKEEVYDSKAPNLVAALPVNVNTLALNEFSDEVVVYKEAVAASKAPNLVAALPVNVNTLEENEFNDAVWASIEALNEFIDAVNAVNDAVWAANELVKVNTVESNPSNKSALVAYDADAIEPDIDIVPVDIILPDTVILPDKIKLPDNAIAILWYSY